jgi:hypothetical protein
MDEMFESLRVSLNGKRAFYDGMSGDLFLLKTRKILGGKKELRGVTR